MKIVFGKIGHDKNNIIKLILHFLQIKNVKHSKLYKNTNWYNKRVKHHFVHKLKMKKKCILTQEMPIDTPYYNNRTNINKNNAFLK